MAKDWQIPDPVKRCSVCGAKPVIRNTGRCRFHLNEYNRLARKGKSLENFASQEGDIVPWRKIPNWEERWERLTGRRPHPNTVQYVMRRLKR